MRPKTPRRSRTESPESASDAARRGFWERLDLPTKVIGALVVAAGAAVSVYVGVAGNPFAASTADEQARSDPAAVAARQVQRCMAAHDLRAPRVTVGLPVRRLTFQRCDWPPLTDTSTDGYSEIVDAVSQVPGLANAAPFNKVDRFAAPCDEITVTYVLAQSSTREFVSRRLERGRVYLATGVPGKGRTRLVLQRLNFVPAEAWRFIPAEISNDRIFFVLHSGHFQPFDATCKPQR
jgi:hypothetical protein